MRNKIKRIGILFVALLTTVSFQSNKINIFAEEQLKEEINWAIDPKTATDDQYIKFEDEHLKNIMLDNLRIRTNKDDYGPNNNEITVGEAKELTEFSIYLTDRENLGEVDSNIYYPYYDIEKWEPIKSLKGVEFFKNINTFILNGGNFDSNNPEDFKKSKENKIKFFDCSLEPLEKLRKIGGMYITDSSNEPIKIPKSVIERPGYVNIKGNALWRGLNWDKKFGNLSEYERSIAIHKEIINDYEKSNKYSLGDFLGESDIHLGDKQLQFLNIKDTNFNNGHNTFTGALSCTGCNIEDIRYLENNNSINNFDFSEQTVVVKPTKSTILNPIKVNDYKKLYIGADKYENLNGIGNIIGSEDIGKNIIFNEDKITLKKDLPQVFSVNFEYDLKDKHPNYTYEDVKKHMVAYYKYTDSNFDDGNYDDIYGNITPENIEIMQKSMNNTATRFEYSGRLYFDLSGIKWDANLFTPETITINKLIGEEITEGEYKNAIKNIPENVEKFEIVNKVDTNEPGDKKALIKLTFKDDSTKEVEVQVKVRNKAGFVENDIFNKITVVKGEIVPWGEKYNLTDNITELRSNSGLKNIVDITKPKINTKQPGNYTGKLKLEFDDGSSLTVDIPVRVLPKPQTDAENILQ